MRRQRLWLPSLWLEPRSPCARTTIAAAAILRLGRTTATANTTGNTMRPVTAAAIAALGLAPAAITEERTPMRKRYLFVALAVFFPLATNSLAWDGVDTESGNDVEIGSGNLVRPGRDIEVYDYGSGSYRDVEVQSIRRSGSSVEVEVYDNESGEYRTFEMEDE